MSEPKPRRKRFRRIRRLIPGIADIRRHRTELLLALLSGLCGALVFPKYQFSTLAWIALAPFLLALSRTRGPALLWIALAFGVPWHYLSLFWLNTLVIFNPFIPLAVPLLAFVLTVLFGVPFAYLASWILRRQPDWLSPFTIATAWVGIEYLRGIGEIAFPWNYLGHSQGYGPLGVMINWAEVGGVGLLSWFVALSNATFAVLSRRIVTARANRSTLQSDRSPLWPMAAHAALPLSTLLLALVCAMGLRTEARRDYRFRAHDQTSATLEIAIIQPNVSQLDKWAAGGLPFGDPAREQIETGLARGLMQLVADTSISTGTAPKPRLYILPESAFLTPAFVYETGLHELLAKTSAQLGADIFFGADAREPLTEYTKRLALGYREASLTEKASEFLLPKFDQEAEAAGRMAVFNSAWLVKPDTGLSTRVYHKISLVPFGETAPILGLIPWLQEKIMMVGSFQRGTEQTLFETEGIPYGAMICFESSFGWMARGLVRGGARFLCVLTNDAWYDPAYARQSGGFWSLVFRTPMLRTLASSGPDQHFAQSIFRAIETRTPVVRAANTGISALINPLGEITHRLPFDEQGVIRAQLSAPVRHQPLTKQGALRERGTTYVRRGDFFAQLCLAACIFLTIWEWRTRRRRPKTTSSAT